MVNSIYFQEDIMLSKNNNLIDKFTTSMYGPSQKVHFCHQKVCQRMKSLFYHLSVCNCESRLNQSKRLKSKAIYDKLINHKKHNTNELKSQILVEYSTFIYNRAVMKDTLLENIESYCELRPGVCGDYSENSLKASLDSGVLYNMVCLLGAFNNI